MIPSVFWRFRLMAPAACRRIGLMSSEFFRFAMLCCASLAVAGFFGHAWGAGVFTAGLMARLFSHLNYLAKLILWLESDGREPMPETRSKISEEIFSRVYKSRKQLLKNTRRLQVRENRYRRTLAAMPEGIILVKRNWELSWCNGLAESYFGIRSEENAGQAVPDLVRDARISGYLSAGNLDEPLTWVPERMPDVTLEVSVVVADKKNALIIARDITERERLDATRRDFVANVSHELRTPLTVLSGFLDMASVDSSGRVSLLPRHLDLMRQQAGRMSSLIGDLLTLSRLDKEAEEKKPEVIELDRLVEQIAGEIQSITNDHAVACETSRLAIMGFPGEVRSAIVNLMTNAVRYTPEGGHIHAGVRVLPDGSAAVSVTDDGIGIDKKDIPRLTERFYRVDKSRSRDTGGTGLGLAIVKHVLIRHHAKMKIDSEPGKGSTFTLIFPPESRVSLPEDGGGPCAVDESQPAA